MKSVSAGGVAAGWLGRALDLGDRAQTLFAGGLLALLLILVGSPLAMGILMSFRTGFPGEGGPFTAQNFVEAYSDPATYAVLWNTLLFSVGTVTVTLIF